eukprot:SAG11_NODE_47_length_20431_cov_7.472752_7_plen_137_part_00
MRERIGSQCLRLVAINGLRPKALSLAYHSRPVVIHAGRRIPARVEGRSGAAARQAANVSRREVAEAAEETLGVRRHVGDDCAARVPTALAVDGAVSIGRVDLAAAARPDRVECVGGAGAVAVHGEQAVERELGVER